MISRQKKIQFRIDKKKLRHRLIRDIIIILTVMGGITYSVFFLLDKQYRESFASAQTEYAARESVQRYRSFIEPLTSSLIVAREWGENGLINIGGADDVTMKFIPLLKQLPQIEALLIANNNGQFYELKKELNGWIISKGIEENNKIRIDGKSLDSTLRVVDKFSHEKNKRLSDYEWYRGGKESLGDKQFIWTSPNSPQSEMISHIFESSAWKQDTLVSVISFQVRLLGFIELMETIRNSESNHTFLFNRQNILYANPKKSTIKNEDQIVFVPINNVTDEKIKTFLSLLNNDEFYLDEPVHFVFNDVTWWGTFYPLNDNNSILKVGCLVNEKTILENLSSNKLIVYLVFTLGFLAAVILIFIIFRLYTRQMDKLIYRRINPDQIETEIPEIISGGEGPTVEFKSTMRMNLKSGKFGKEIEHAWLKTIAAYLNSDGGILLLGVNDDGKIIGVDADNFENEDRCRLHFKNVFNQHIGSELSRYIRMNILEINEKNIVIVECDPSPEPAFLLGKNDEEEFYIRSGPSSIKLSVSKSLKYIRAREAEKEK